VRNAKFDLATLEPSGVAARGRRLAPRAVSRVHVVPRRGEPPRPRPATAARPAPAAAGPGPAPGRGQASLF
jgi:hypothetical protein